MHLGTTSILSRRRLEFLNSCPASVADPWQGSEALWLGNNNVINVSDDKEHRFPDTPYFRSERGQMARFLFLLSLRHDCGHMTCAKCNLLLPGDGPGPVDSLRYQNIKNCSIYTRFTMILVKKLERECNLFWDFFVPLCYVSLLFNCCIHKKCFQKM